MIHRTTLQFHLLSLHDDVIKWNHFPRYWPFVWGIYRPPLNSPHKGQWRGALMFSLIYAWINGLVNNREPGDLRRHRAHYDVIVMILWPTPHKSFEYRRTPHFSPPWHSQYQNLSGSWWYGTCPTRTTYIADLILPTERDTIQITNVTSTCKVKYSTMHPNENQSSFR